jgi:hypothetical protein
MAQLPAIPELDQLKADAPVMVETFILKHTSIASQWLDHAQALMQGEEVNPNDVLMAICNANDHLNAVTDLQPSFAAFVVGVEAAIQELVHQRDEATEAYEQLEEEMEARIRQGIEEEFPDVIAQAFATDEDAEEAEIDLIARQMVLGDEEDIVNELTKALARKLRRAKEQAQWYRENGIPGEEYTEDADDESEGDADDDLTD